MKVSRTLITVLAIMAFGGILNLVQAQTCGKAGTVMFTYVPGQVTHYPSLNQCKAAKAAGEAAHTITSAQAAQNPGICCSMKWHYVYSRSGCSVDRNGQHKLVMLKQVCN